MNKFFRTAAVSIAAAIALSAGSVATASAATGGKDASIEDMVDLYKGIVTDDAAQIIDLHWDVRQSITTPPDWTDVSVPLVVSLDEMEGLRAQSYVLPLYYIAFVGAERVQLLGPDRIDTLSSRAERACIAVATVGEFQRMGNSLTNADIRAVVDKAVFNTSSTSSETDVIIKAIWQGFDNGAQACKGKHFG